MGAGTTRTDERNNQRRLQAEALADPTRFAVLSLLRDSAGPMTVAEVTASVGVHHTAVRAHLAKLRDAGFVAESQAAPQGRGRPQLLYVWVSDDPSAAPSDTYAQLSRLLATAVRTGRTPRQVGQDAGRQVVEREVGERSETGSGLDAVDLIQEQATRLGFEPTRRTDGERADLVLGHCPFADVAADDPETICALHLGLAEGVANSVGGVEVLGMVVNDPHRAGCQLQLQRVTQIEIERPDENQEEEGNG